LSNSLGNFVFESVPLVLNQAEAQDHVNNNKRKVIAVTAFAIIGAIVFACFVGSNVASGHNNWVNERTPKVLVNLAQIHRMRDLKSDDNTILSQVSQIKHRSESLNELPKTHIGFSNLFTVMKNWSSLMLKKGLTGVEKLIAQDILDMMENYQKLRSSKLNSAEKKQWLKENWTKINSELKKKFDEDTVKKFVGLQNETGFANSL